MIDGAVARKTGTVSEFGSRLDTIANIVFVAVCLIKLLPVLDIPVWLYIWIAIIAFIKVTNITVGYIPSQLAKENKKFIYGAIKKGARAKDFEAAIQWLINAGLLHKILRVNKIERPLKFYEDIGAFKLFCLIWGYWAL